jgi:tyrosine-protein phosphatase YwqE
MGINTGMGIINELERVLFSRKAGCTELLRGMTDVHTHLLPGVDDGARSLNDAVAALTYLQGLGVRRIFLTPHVMADLPANSPEALQARYAELAGVCPPGLELRLAAEYMLDAGFTLLIKRGLLTLADRHVLVETPYRFYFPDLENMLYELALSGYVPVIAHPERYAYMQASHYIRLKERGCRLQLNLFSLAGLYGAHIRKKASFILKEGLYDYTGSDFHHLEVYDASLKRLRLDRYQLKEAERLMENNTSLWDS